MSFPWKADIQIKGVTPLLIHNGRTASPLDAYAKKMKLITSKRKKTEEDIRTLMDIQWEGALYWDEAIGLHMPVENMMAALLKAARKHKMGQQISGFVFDEAIGFPIITDFHNDWEGLHKDPNNKFIKTVSVQRSKTLSCRPMFNSWEIKFEFFIDESLLTLDDAKMILTTMSSRIGLGVWTPSHPKPGNYGRFLFKEIRFTNSDTGEIKKYENKEI